MADADSSQGLKDFAQVLAGKEEKKMVKQFHQGIDPQAFAEMTIKEPTQWQLLKSRAIRYSAPVLLTIFTGPFNTVSMLLQSSSPPSDESFARKLEIYPDNKFVRAGIYGDNKIYRPFELKGYKQCLDQMGKEGLRGFYKGNLCSILLVAANSRIRSYLYEYFNKISNFSEQWKSNLLTILTCTIADFLIMPLMTCQTRLTFQNSLTNFRTYSGIIDVVRKTSPTKLFAGSSILLVKNSFFILSWKSLFPESPLQSFILSTALSHALTYPFMTVIRQLQTNDLGTNMMNQRQENLRQCLKRIWQEGGPRGFYRGFMGYALVHTFLNFIMIDMDVRSGYFNEMSAA